MQRRNAATISPMIKELVAIKREDFRTNQEPNLVNINPHLKETDNRPAQRQKALSKDSGDVTVQR